ncbi:ATP-binding protein [Streptomyces sp. TBY4]|uniref:ATP-binding protein n=1 Tax=Streptomyces sp. TBY4 TaxID=2962030 RepID=UPI0020B70A30|nr:ATP-binding protein [Streptomyces sp. TBY4]MCP3758385.1 ATP-binding protein [Streptomyces sp. TBY4]
MKFEDYDIAAPDPAGLVASLSSLGYSLEAAVADLVDNSISATARHIDIAFTWAGKDSWIAVVDDGDGMSEEELVTAMTVAARGPATARTNTDLGRFGVGLKSASFSQARQLTVASSAGGEWCTRTWDLDVVEATGRWLLRRRADPETISAIDRLRGGASKGTVVLWRRLKGYNASGIREDDEKVQQQFYSEATRARSHLGMVFGRFLTGAGRRNISVAETAVEPWDPFMGTHPSVQRLPVEHLPLANDRVRVEAFVLPSAQRLSADVYDRGAGPGGWLGQQGFYVYRRNRLILAGDWLGLPGMRREERYNLARIAVDIPAETDVEWGVDVRKASVVPPLAVRRHLRRIATQARTRASEVLRHRGRVSARTHGDPLLYAWTVKRDNGQVSCTINRSHPLVRELLRPGRDSTPEARALIRLLEETVPVTALRAMHETDTEDDPVPFGGAITAPPEAVEVAEQVFKSLVTQGRSPSAARDRIRVMPPFDQMTGFWTD